MEVKRRRHLIRVLTILVGAVVAMVLTLEVASAQVPTELPSDLPTELPTEQPSDDPSPSPSPSPSPTGSPTETSSPSEQPSDGGPTSTPSSEPTTQPSGGPSDQPSDGATPTPAPSGGTADLGTVGVVTGGGSPPPAGEPEPEVAPGRDGGAGDGSGVVTDGGTTPTGGVGTGGAVLASSAFAAAIPGAYSLTVLAALLGVGVLSMTLSLTDRGLLLARDPATGGTNVERTRNWRVMAGTGLLGAAALVAIIGYLKISIETLVPVQLVYMASAGFGVVVLAAAGGALLISEQLRADETRIRDLEDAIGTLADRLAPSVSEPPRLLDRSFDREAS